MQGLKRCTPPAPTACAPPGLQVQRSVFEQQAQSRAGNNAAKNLQQAVCPVSGLIINKEESRIKDHESGRNFKSVPVSQSINLLSSGGRSSRPACCLLLCFACGVERWSGRRARGPRACGGCDARPFASGCGGGVPAANGGAPRAQRQ